ncbi:hypothetical protein CN996_28275 [Bacillus cereus]|nr:hypothetical protein CN996_28275 [Bacillus cereus]
MNGKLDKVLKATSTKENIKQIYLEYEYLKTDTLYDPPKIRIQMGTDGVDYLSFRNNLDQHCENIAKRIVEGRYFFKPFREIHIQKIGGTEGDYRIISIASISDMLVQKLIHKCIYPAVEDRFKDLPNVSFAYREGKSAPMAAKYLYKYIREGYTYVFDADIQKFFDTIPHNLLNQKVAGFLDGKDTLIYTYLKRFISVDRVEQDSYIKFKEKENIFKRKKPRTTKEPYITKRIEGIPQGGVFSGIIANIYMHEFDQWVIEDLGTRYQIKYIRYADDFLILYKNQKDAEDIKVQVDNKIRQLGLRINWDKTKVKTDLTKKDNYVEYVGFSISQNGIRIKDDNIKKFKSGVLNILHRTNIYKSEEYSLKFLITRLTFKILGNEALGLRRCTKCGLYESRRNWLSYFSIITDVQQIRALDTWIRREIYKWYYKLTGKRLKAATLKSLGLLRLEDVYRRTKKEEKLIKAKTRKMQGGMETFTCHCKPLDANKSREHLIHELLLHNY